MRKQPDIIDIDDGVSYNTGPVEYKRLWSAVMLRALDDLADRIRLYKSIDHPEVRYSDPYEWVLEDNTLRPGGFKWICGIMGWCPDETRLLLMRNWRNMMKRGWRSQRAIAEKTTIAQQEQDDDTDD